jgi:hypothetical protein
MHEHLDYNSLAFKTSARGRPIAYARLTSRTRVFGDGLFRAPPQANPPQVSQSAYLLLSTTYSEDSYDMRGWRKLIAFAQGHL